MKLVILAGGKGTRMGVMTESIPKPMVPLMRKPILEHQINLAKKYGLDDIIISTGYMGDVIRDYFKDGKEWGVHIQYSPDPFPLGTAGAVKHLEQELKDDFVLFYGDTIMDIDLDSLVRLHVQKESMATLVVHPNDHPHDSDLLETDKDNRVLDFYSKPHDQKVYHRNLVNAALYVLSPEVFQYIEKDTFHDFGKDIFPKLVSLNKSLYAYNTAEYIKDIGTIERLEEVEEDFLSGKVQRLNRSNKQKAVFIDRDGVINFEAEPLNTPDKFNILPNVDTALKALNRSDYLSVVVTNQPIIAKGFASVKQVCEIHNYMECILGKEGVYLDRIYYCPHHPEKGFKGENEAYKIVCKCRKPDTGMIDKAVLEMNIDLHQSFIIGDRTVDIMTGINANLHTVLVRQGYAGEDQKYVCQPDFIFDDLLEATRFIVNGYDKLSGDMDKYFPKRLLVDKENPVVVVGGLSRSGKSTLTSVIRKYLEQLGIKVKILKLDNWLLPEGQRTLDMDVRNRYQYDAVEKDIKALLNKEKVTMNRYDSKTRSVKKNADFISITPSEVLLIDGVIALDHEFLRGIADVSFFTYVPEEVRKKRFYNFYRYKSFSEEKIDFLYHQRIIDEVGIIGQSQQYAENNVDMDFSL